MSAALGLGLRVSILLGARLYFRTIVLLCVLLYFVRTDEAADHS